MLRKTIRVLDSAVNRIVLVLCLLLFLVCLYAMLDAAAVYLNANDKSVLKYKPKLGESPEVVQELSKEVTAWLTVDGTNIDYPVMQGRTNDVYLNKDPYGNFSLSGSIFLDSRNSSDYSDAYSMIYGHHMDYGSMFGALDEFYKREYFEAHRTGELAAVSGARYAITFFASCKAPATESLIFDPNETDREALLQYLAEHAAIYLPQSVEPGAKILALSTCQSADTFERMIVFGVLRKAD